MTDDILSRLDQVQGNEVKLGERTYKIDLQRDIGIDGSVLSDEFAEQPTLYVYYAMLCARADANAKLAKIELEEIEAETDNKVREEAKQHGDRVTENSVKSRVTVDSQVKEAKRKYMNAQSIYTDLRTLEASFKMRADMLIRLGAQQRAEMDMTGMNMREPGESMREAVKNVK